MRVGIVGGGITGLALHHHLRQADVESVVFEAGAEPGGVVRSARVDGRVLELGPQRTRLSPQVEALVQAAGVGDELVEAADRPTYVYCDGKLRLVPFDFRDAVATDLLSWRGKLRALLEPLTGPPRDGETVREYLVRTFGCEVADRVVGPLYGGLYASRPDEMPVEHSLARALRKRGVSRSLLVAALRARIRGRDPPPVVSFEDGLGTVPEALYRRYGADVELDAPVEAVHGADDGFAVETPGGTTTVDEVVLTTPADVTADLVDDVAPGAASHLERLNYNPLAVVHLDADAELDAAGYQVQFDEALRTLGVTCNASLFGREGLHTCFLGGRKTPELVEWSDDRLGTVAAREFTRVTGYEARPLHVHRLPRGMPAYDESWSALEGVDLPPGVHLCANYESRAGIPGRVAEAGRLAGAIAGRT